jgi:hypothetical protein
VEDLVPWTRFYLRKLEFCVIGIHTPDFLPCWSTQNLDNLNKLVHSTFTRKQRLINCKKKESFSVTSLLKSNCNSLKDVKRCKPIKEGN